jgi:hypothetical protein
LARSPLQAHRLGGTASPPLRSLGTRTQHSPLQDYLGGLSANLRPAYRSYELESLEDPLRRTEWGADPSQSYLGTSQAASGGALRETAINSVLDEDDLWNQYLNNSR